MKSILKNNKTKICFLLGLVIFIICALNFSSSIPLVEEVEVEPNTSLIYYLSVNYDGVDKGTIDRVGIQSNDTTIANIKSGYIYVEDKIPDGLIFDGFVTTNDGSFGAVRRSDGASCEGFVVDDTNGLTDKNNYYGLHYDESTRNVSFKVKNLGAGCKLVVGIKTITPTIDRNNRVDFYNYATAREDDYTINSNLVHVWMGKGEFERFDVEYQYEEGTPDNAPTLPPTMNYREGSTVNVATNPYMEGYRFLGWKTSDATITSSTFRMPAKKVVLTGSFEKIDSHKVTYEIEGDIPEGYLPPLEKEYYPNDIVNFDTLEKGSLFNGYEFLGWQYDESLIEINEYNEFVMPNEDVKFIGRFELKKYKVEYRFYDGILPPNYEELLPSTKEYLPGETVNLEEIEDVSGYAFSGWYKDSTFTMPESDVIVFGEWRISRGVFAPTITKEVMNDKDYFNINDTVYYKITVTNTADYAINNVIIRENNINSEFLPYRVLSIFPLSFEQAKDYNVISKKYVEIPTLAANSSMTIYASYVISEEDSGSIINEVEIVGGASNEGYDLDVTQEYKATAKIEMKSKLTLCKNVVGDGNNQSFQFLIEGNSFETWIKLSDNECKSFYIDSGEYTVSEVTHQEYTLESIEKSNTEEELVIDGYKATMNVNGSPIITFTNKHKKKGYHHSFGEATNKVEYVEMLLYDVVKEGAVLDNVKSTYVSSTSGIDFSQISSDTNGKGVYIYSETKNDKYPVYYYRGDVKNNNVIFANFCWKIVRTTDTGGIKLIYNGVPNNGICNNSTNSLGDSYFNAVSDNKYNEYMYDINSSSSIKKKIDTWYASKIIGYESYLEDTVWCVDRNGLSIAGNYHYYGYGSRVVRNKEKPIVTCPLKEDSYTTKQGNNSKGNKLFDYPIALLTADEVHLAGGIYYENNSTMYLVGDRFWLLSPILYGPGFGSVGYFGFTGDIGSASNLQLWSTTARPAISLNHEILVRIPGNSSVAGTVTNPYIVVEK